MPHHELVKVSLAKRRRLDSNSVSSSSSSQMPVENIEQKPKIKPPSYVHRYYEHPSEAEHRTQEQLTWRNSFALNIGIATAAVFTLIAAGGTYVETKRQADALWIDETGWITQEETGVELMNSSDITKIPELDMIVNYKNVGKAPAVITYIVGKQDTPERYSGRLDESINTGKLYSIKKACEIGTKQLPQIIHPHNIIWPNIAANWQFALRRTIETQKSPPSFKDMKSL